MKTRQWRLTTAEVLWLVHHRMLFLLKLPAAADAAAGGLQERYEAFAAASSKLESQLGISEVLAVATTRQDLKLLPPVNNKHLWVRRDLLDALFQAPADDIRVRQLRYAHPQRCGL